MSPGDFNVQPLGLKRQSGQLSELSGQVGAVLGCLLMFIQVAKSYITLLSMGQTSDSKAMKEEPVFLPATGGH